MSWTGLFGAAIRGAVKPWRRARASEDSAGSRAATYRAAFDQSFQLLALVDRDGRVSEANVTLLAYFGLRAGDVEGRRLDELGVWGGDEDTVRLGAAMERALIGNFVRDDVSAIDAGEGSRLLDLSMKPLRRPGGEVAAVMVEARDVTERRHEQAMLAQAQKAEAISQLTSGIAHDFNNLLTVIAGNLEMLRNELGDGSEAQQRADRAIEASFHGKEMIAKLLTLARKQALRREAVAAGAMLDDVKLLLDDTLGDRYAVTIEAQAATWPCHADRGQLQAALLNLALNARDAMPDGGVVTLRVENVPMGSGSARARRLELAPGDYVAISVIDHGTGIAPEEIERVTEPFYTTKPKGLGSGLGLSTSHGFAVQSGGALAIDSEPDAGTRVTIYLPRAAEGAMPPSDETPEAA